MKIIGKISDYRLLVEIDKNELSAIAGEKDSSKLTVGAELKLDVAIRELDNIRYDRRTIESAAKTLREAADRLERVNEMTLVERPVRKTARNR